MFRKLQIQLAITLVALGALVGAGGTIGWAPTLNELLAPASAGDEDETGTDAGAARGGISAGLGGTAEIAGDDDDSEDTETDNDGTGGSGTPDSDTAQDDTAAATHADTPQGGISTGLGGTADSPRTAAASGTGHRGQSALVLLGVVLMLLVLASFAGWRTTRSKWIGQKD
jgi:hypothetical protein